MVEIVGAGIAGLCLGIRLRRRGVETTIYEAGDRAGGLCTGWRRGDYEFNGCLHWLLGSNAGSSFHDMWRTVTDIDSLQFIHFDERADIEVPDEDGDTWHFHLYNDIDRMEGYLNRLAPEDKQTIADWMGDVRTVMRFLPDFPPFPTEETFVGKWSHYARLWPMWRMLPLMGKWGKLTTTTFCQRFKNSRLREAVSRLYMNETRMTVIIVGQAYMARRVAAYPIGGSRALTDLLVETYKSLGGKLRLGCKVEKIRVEGRRAKGLLLANGESTTADAVCSCADWRWTVGVALDGKFCTAAQRRLLTVGKEALFYSYCRVHIGIAQPLDTLPHFMRVVADITLPDGTHFDQMEMEVSNFDTTLTPTGKTTITVNFTTREGQFWIDLRQNSPEKYRKAKQEVSDAAISVLRQKFDGQIDTSKIEMVNVTTPATYARYTRNSLGSSQGWAPNDNIMRRLPVDVTLPGLNRFAMAGHWMEAGGGVPIALLSAIRAERCIMRQL